jgi:Leucine-rich repeat (LRR) protein
MKNLKIYIGALAFLILSGCSLTSNNNPVGQINNNQNKNQNPAPVIQSSKVLNLSSQNLKQIPGYVFNQTNLEELNVSNNQLTGAIQAEIRQLKNLKVLNASNNQMTGVPAEVGQLSNLQILDLSNNQLTGLPYELGNLSNLKTLNLQAIIIPRQIWIKSGRHCRIPILFCDPC